MGREGTDVDRPAVLGSEEDDRFYVQRSNIPDAGDGLFARVPLESGARLAVVGMLVTPLSAADRCTRYADAYKYRINGALLIPLGFAAMVNHAPASNVEQIVEDGCLYLQTRRAIAADEELFLTYGEDAQRRLAEMMRA
jgi:hypothetical protein